MVFKFPGNNKEKAEQQRKPEAASLASAMAAAGTVDPTEPQSHGEVESIAATSLERNFLRSPHRVVQNYTWNVI